VGAWQSGHGLYLHGKAWLAQYLLRQAWAKTRETGEAVSPWPGADTHPLARLLVPRLGIDQIVLAGASGRTLAFGPELVDNSDPAGGSGVTVLSGHRDTHFSFLAQLRTGDEIVLRPYQPSTLLRFRVTGAEIFDSRHRQLAASPTQQGLWLVTCYPFAALAPGGPRRYVVYAVPAVE
jgi:sortase A